MLLGIKELPFQDEECGKGEHTVRNEIEECRSGQSERRSGYPGGGVLNDELLTPE